MQKNLFKGLIPLFLLVVLFVSCQQNKLPSINIEKESEIQWETKEPCDIYLSDNAESLHFPARIKCRGGISSKYDKHSYALELKEKAGLTGLPLDDDWILNANYIDKTFMRHKISYDLFRQMGEKNKAPQCSYTELSLSNNYQGLYVLMEKVNAGFLELDKQDSMAMLFKDPPIFRKNDLSVSGENSNFYGQKYPKPQLKDHSVYMNSFRNFLVNSSDSVFVSEIEDWIDIDNIIDWHLILLFSNNEDGILKNFYLYKTDANTPFKICIWDYDHSYGRDGDNELSKKNRIINWERSLLFSRLADIPETGYTQALKKRWQELKEANILTSNNFEHHIKLNHKLINKAVEANFEKWPANEKWYFDNNTYQQEIELMKDFVRQQTKELNLYISEL